MNNYTDREHDKALDRLLKDVQAAKPTEPMPEDFSIDSLEVAFANLVAGRSGEVVITLDIPDHISPESGGLIVEEGIKCMREYYRALGGGELKVTVTEKNTP